MNNPTLSRNDSIRLAEYKEAGDLCRANETLSRTTYQIYLVLLTALGGFIIKEHCNLSRYGNFALALVGFFTSGFCAASINQMRKYYSTYMARMREIECELGKIENKLGMQLYTMGYEVWKNSGIKVWKTRRIRLGGKGAFVLLVTGYATAFLVYGLYLFFVCQCSEI